MSEISPEHDYVPIEEIDAIAHQNQVAIERNFADELAVFRAQVFAKMIRHGAMIGREGWAVFVPDSAPADKLGKDGSAVGAVLDRKEILIKVGTIKNTHIGIIRLVSNELVDSETDSSYVTEDVTIDTENEAQYLTSALSLAQLITLNESLDREEQETVPEDHIIEHGQTRDKNVGKSTASIFAVSLETGELATALTLENEEYTPVYDIDDDNTREEGIMPFGHFACQEDRYYALAKARALFEEIVDSEPTFVMIKPSSNPTYN